MISESESSHKTWLWRPRLRPVEAFPIQNQTQRALCLRDPHRLARQILMLSPAAGAILSLMDGNNDLRDIQAALFRSFGQLVHLEKIQELVRVLDENLFLEGEYFESQLAREKAAFAEISVRPAFLAGQAYPAESEALAAELNTYYTALSETGTDADQSVSGLPRGLIVPHIDFNRGGFCYAKVYSLLTGEEPPGLVVILGTAHSPTENFLVFSGKDFETPFGPARCARTIARELLDDLGPAFTQDEFAHRGEHSVEFQAVWLMSLFSQAEEMRILPVLCASFHSLIEEGIDPEESPAYERPFSALKKQLDSWSETKGPVTILASADLSHVGPQFGDDFRVTPGVRAEVREYDLQALEAVTKGDHRRFFRTLARQKDRTHICGLPAIYTMLRLLDGVEGRLLSYDQWTGEEGRGLVSFAGLVFS